MRKTWIRRGLYILLLLFYFLHNDLWLWHDARLVLGMPAGLFYHVLYCAAAAGLMALLVRYAWPAYLERGEDGGER